MVGLWYGGKADMSLFLKPLAESLKKLYTHGMMFLIQHLLILLSFCVHACRYKCYSMRCY